MLDGLPESIQPRSRVIGHAPVGVGSGRCEGLIGYLVRLARAHHVNPRELVRMEFMPHCHRTGGIQYANFFSGYARTIHGVGPYAEDFLRVVECLTGRQDLRPLTLLPWRSVIPANSPRFLAREVRWCRHCLLEARLAREYRPYPLVWSLEAYHVCGSHRTPLVNRCPTCGKPQPFVPYLPDQSHCSYCGRWLGFGWEEDRLVAPSEESVWVSLALEDLVAAGPNIDDESVAAAWRQCCIRLVGHYGKGAKKVASRALGLTPTAFNTWLVKGQKPSFPQLLQLCRRIDRTPAALLGAERVAEKSTAVFPETGKPDTSAKRISGEVLQKIRRCFEVIVADKGDCRPTGEICQELGVSRGFLAYRFRTLCKRQSEKHRKWRASAVATRRKNEHQVIKEVVKRIAQEGIYPARRRVDRALKAFKLSLIRQDLRVAYKEALKET